MKIVLGSMALSSCKSELVGETTKEIDKVQLKITERKTSLQILLSDEEFERRKSSERWRVWKITSVVFFISFKNSAKKAI